MTDENHSISHGDKARHVPPILERKYWLVVNESVRKHSRALLALRSLSSSTATVAPRLLEYRPGYLLRCATRQRDKATAQVALRLQNCARTAPKQELATLLHQES